MSDGVIHTAFIHDFSAWAGNCEKDRRAIDAMGTALVGSDRPLVITSGAALLTPRRRRNGKGGQPWTILASTTRRGEP